MAFALLDADKYEVPFLSRDIDKIGWYFPDFFTLKLGRLIADYTPRFLPKPLFRLRLAESLYTAIRLVDNRIDDEQLTRDEAQHLLSLTVSPKENQDPLEILLRNNQRYIRQLGETTFTTFQESTNDLIDAWEFDYTRRKHFADTGKPMLFTQEQLDTYVLKMESTSIMRGLLAVLGEDDAKLHLLDSLVLAARRNFYFVRDLAEDIGEGIVNIPLEYLGNTYTEGLQQYCRSNYPKIRDDETFLKFIGCESPQTQQVPKIIRKLGVELSGIIIGTTLRQLSRLSDEPTSMSCYVDEAMKSFLEGLPEPAHNWVKDQVSQGIQMLQEYRDSKVSANFKLTTRYVLHNKYFQPAWEMLHEWQRML